MADLTPNNTTLDSKSTSPEELKAKSGDLRENIDSIIAKGRPWPQASTNRGFLPPTLVTPYKDFVNDQDLANSNSDKQPINSKYGEYEYTDWLGQKITPNGLIVLDTADRFNASKNIPKTATELKDSPYSTRDNYMIFGDYRTDYFRHGLQIIDNLTPIENPESGESNLRLGQFRGTPYENNDPVIFGFEIIIDDLSSPLLNGSISDFLRIYSSIDEIKYKIPVYEDFKQQFIKFFRTRSTVSINAEQDTISKSSNGANIDSQKNIFMPGKKAYMSYYLKKVGGLANLVESNTTDNKKYLVDYRKDKMTLEFTEDVSLSLGALAQLYKLLYWSKPNGKNLVPENLLRFNCDIIVSECRNFNRVRKAMDSGDLEIIKDNVSRYVYSLRECQFYFNTMTHGNDIDLANIATTDTYSIEFDYKYSAVKFEKFVPSGNFGKYVGYDGGAIWKIKNSGRISGVTQSATTDTSFPRSFTVGTNIFNENGVRAPFVLSKFGVNLPSNPEGFTDQERVDNQQIDENNQSDLEKFKRYAKDQTAISAELRKQIEEKNAQDLLKNSTFSQLRSNTESNIKNFVEKNKTTGVPKSLSELTRKNPDLSVGNFIERLKDKTVKNAKNEIARIVNNRVNLLSRTINKLLIDFVGRKGISPPQNIYHGPQDPMGIAMSNFTDRFFYDIRNELANFGGDALSAFLNSATYKK